MRLVSSRSNPEAQDVSRDFGGFAGAVNAIVGKLVRRQPLCVEGAEARFVPEQGASRHGHAAGKQDLDGGVEPKNGNARGTQEFRTSRLRVGTATKSKDGALLEF